MIQDYFCNTVYVRSRDLVATVYEDWISKKQYTDNQTAISCRVSNLNNRDYKDLQLLQWIDDVQISVKKLYTNAGVNIEVTDYVIRKWESYQVVAKYEVQDKDAVRFNKYFIKLVKE